MNISVVTGTNPLSGRMYGRLHTLTGKCLTDIGSVDGPRCCNRNTLKTLKETVQFVKDD